MNPYVIAGTNLAHARAPRLFFPCARCETPKLSLFDQKISCHGLCFGSTVSREANCVSIVRETRPLWALSQLHIKMAQFIMFIFHSKSGWRRSRDIFFVWVHCYGEAGHALGRVSLQCPGTDADSLLPFVLPTKHLTFDTLSISAKCESKYYSANRLSYLQFEPFSYEKILRAKHYFLLLDKLQNKSVSQTPQNTSEFAQFTFSFSMSTHAISCTTWAQFCDCLQFCLYLGERKKCSELNHCHWNLLHQSCLLQNDWCVGSHTRWLLGPPRRETPDPAFRMDAARSRRFEPASRFYGCLSGENNRRGKNAIIGE